jgi:hypothetical protein
VLKIGGYRNYQYLVFCVKDENGECIPGNWDWTDYCLVGMATIFILRFFWMISPPGQRGKEFPLDR